MILVGNQRGGASELAQHLMKDENERVQLHELRGFVGQDLETAFQESYAISRATRCKQHLFSLSLNPPKEADVSTKDFEKTIDEVEERLGLSGQPRAVVFHEKNGRRHAHAVWCRINTDEMKAVQLSHHKTKLNTLARELYIEHGWRMPDGFRDKSQTNPRNYSLAEWQQAKRAGKDADALKGMFQSCWGTSDSRAAFGHAIKERGYILAKGDRRGFIAVDRDGEAYSVSRWVGVKAKQVRERLGKPDGLPDKDKAHAQAARITTDRLHALKRDELAKVRQKGLQAIEKQARTEDQQARDAAALREKQHQRQLQEIAARNARLRTGIWGAWDCFTGKRRQTLHRNKTEAAACALRDRAERQAQEKVQQDQKQSELQRQREAAFKHIEHAKELRNDIRQLDAAVEFAKAQRREQFKEERKQRRPRQSERPRSRDGPRLER